MVKPRCRFLLCRCFYCCAEQWLRNQERWQEKAEDEEEVATE